MNHIASLAAEYQVNDDASSEAVGLLFVEDADYEFVGGGNAATCY